MLYASVAGAGGVAASRGENESAANSSARGVLDMEIPGGK
jgi:hypothetical protein